MDVGKTYPHAGAVADLTVFSMGGNNYRLAVHVLYRTGRVYIRHVMTHEDYSRGHWRKR